jgi:magnesium transporter
MSYKNKHKVQKAKRHREKAGSAPGTITYLGNRKGLPSNIACITYSDIHYEKTSIEQPEDLNPHGLSEYRQWINIIGLSDEVFMTRIGAITG